MSSILEQYLDYVEDMECGRVSDPKRVRLAQIETDVKSLLPSGF